MAKKASLTTITSTNNNSTVLNANFSALNDALDNTLSLDGSTPNQLAADLDLNSQDIINASNIGASSLTLNGSLVTQLASLGEWEGAWVTATAYAAYDIVSEAGSVYICTAAHTSGTFSTDLAASLWIKLFEYNYDSSAVAITGGTMDGVAITNGSLDSNVTFPTVLADLMGITFAQGDVLYHDGSDLVKLAKGTAGQVLTMNAGATAPEWAAASTGSFSGASVTIAATDAGVNYSTGADYTGWDTETFDEGGWWASSPNPERLTVPSGVTKVWVGCNWVSRNHAASPSTDPTATIALNGTNLSSVSKNVDNDGRLRGQASWIGEVSASDYFTVNFHTQGDTSVDVLAGSKFQIYKIE